MAERGKNNERAAMLQGPKLIAQIPCAIDRWVRDCAYALNGHCLYTIILQNCLYTTKYDVVKSIICLFILAALRMLALV